MDNPINLVPNKLSWARQGDQWLKVPIGPEGPRSVFLLFALGLYLFPAYLLYKVEPVALGVWVVLLTPIFALIIRYGVDVVNRTVELNATHLILTEGDKVLGKVPLEAIKRVEMVGKQPFSGAAILRGEDDQELLRIPDGASDISTGWFAHLALQNKNSPEASPHQFQRDLTRVALGFPPHEPGQTYQVVIPEEQRDPRQALSTLRLHYGSFVLALLLAAGFVGYQHMFSPPGVRNSSTTSWAFLFQLFCFFTFGSIRFGVINKETKDGYGSAHVRVTLSDPPILDGQPIEQVSLNLTPHLPKENKHRPNFPDTITAGGKTYRVNFRYFQPLRDSEEREA